MDPQNAKSVSILLEFDRRGGILQGERGMIFAETTILPSLLLTVGRFSFSVKTRPPVRVGWDSFRTVISRLF